MLVHERIQDMPAPLRWVMIFIKQVGFPIVVCVWLAYQQFVEGKHNTKALMEFKEVIIALKTSIDQQNRILRRNAHHD